MSEAKGYRTVDFEHSVEAAEENHFHFTFSGCPAAGGILICSALSLIPWVVEVELQAIRSAHILSLKRARDKKKLSQLSNFVTVGSIFGQL